MKLIKIFCLDLCDWCQRSLKASVVVLLLVSFSVSLSGAGWNESPKEPILISALAQGNAITDPNVILRNALPIDNKTVRQLQEPLEDISNHLRGKRWAPITKDAKQAAFVLNTRSDKILEAILDERKPQAEKIIAELKTGVTKLQEAVDAKDKEQILETRKALLAQVSDLEGLMVAKFPFEISTEYSQLPQLKGRATINLETTQGTLTVIVDGYSAPVNAGNFVDLVQRGFYDGLPFLPSEDNFVLQTGDPIGVEAGFIEPKTKQYRAIPLEILIQGEEAPIYGTTLEEAGIYLPKLALPFNAYGAVALAHPDIEPNGGSSQFFFFKFDNELTPPGFNLMDGRYSVFGYLVEGKDVLNKLTDKDKIISAKVVDGLDNLVQPKA